MASGGSQCRPPVRYNKCLSNIQAGTAGSTASGSRTAQNTRETEFTLGLYFKNVQHAYYSGQFLLISMRKICYGKCFALVVVVFYTYRVLECYIKGTFNIVLMSFSQLLGHSETFFIRISTDYGIFHWRIVR